MRYLTITSPDINNGSGCRVTLWVAGCSHHCKGCQNPQSWNFSSGKRFNFLKVYKEIYNILKKPYIKGLTLSGGDPLSQDKYGLILMFVFVKLIKLRFPDKDVWVFSGFKYEDAIKNEWRKRLINVCDIMVDGPYKDKLRDTSLPFRGSSNQRILKIKENGYEDISKII